MTVNLSVYRGQLLWEMKREAMVFKGLIQFTPGCLTADPGSGRIYVADTEHGRLAWIDTERRTYHPIATVDGKVQRKNKLTGFRTSIDGFFMLTDTTIDTHNCTDKTVSCNNF